jgi:hypothetical protein
VKQATIPKIVNNFGDIRAMRQWTRKQRRRVWFSAAREVTAKIVVHDDSRENVSDRQDKVTAGVHASSSGVSGTFLSEENVWKLSRRS